MITSTKNYTKKNKEKKKTGTFCLLFFPVILKSYAESELPGKLIW